VHARTNLYVSSPVGNISKYFGKKRESDGHTHEWTVYLKPFQNEDMSAYVKKVHFKLHESYANPNRVVSKPPYEVSETGWGEFEVQVKIHFNDANERPVTFYHVLKLFHGNEGPGGANAGTGSGSGAGSGPTAVTIVQGRKTALREGYDEIVFHEPTQYIHTLLTVSRPISLGAHKHETDFADRGKRTLEAVTTARGRVGGEITEFRNRLALAKETIVRFKQELESVQREKGLQTGEELLD